MVSEYQVEYGIDFEFPYPDVYSYNNLKEAEKRLNYLMTLLDGDKLLSEGVEFVPNYFRIVEVVK